MIGWIALSCNAKWVKRGEDGLYLTSSSPPSLALKTLRYFKTGTSVPGIQLSSHKQALRARVEIPESPIPATAYAKARTLE